ncbi:ATP-dependent RNA helicase DbpA [Sulfurospirillum sp. 1612]|uniref:ATP-dependent RNA helicase DbpA n=1 Tax=Sulfurospirillum sp. 1612 TaxID=3094835 RepID=UPI002F9462FB
MSDSHDFATLGLSPSMRDNLAALGYEQMTPVQALSLPHILSGKDVIAEAKTGSGKTAAFGIGLLSKLDVKNFKIQSLILCPTRELAEQVAHELRNIAKFKHNIKILTLCGGVAFGPQLGSLRHGAHIVVGTPGRILQHLKKESLNLNHVKTLVLDEADRMLDMGFIEEIEKVISHVPKQRQTLLFSATFPDEIVGFASTIQNNPEMVKAASEEVANNVKQYFYHMPSRSKLANLMKILYEYQPKNVIIFCNTKIETDEIAKALRSKNIDALALHGDLEQYERVDVLVQFANHSCPILVATDVAARGLDIKELSMVINYDVPHSQETYTHRIGRTARAGREGIAVTLFDEYETEKVEPYRDETRSFLDTDALKYDKNFAMQPAYMTLVIEGGKKSKMRAGDILGALTKDARLPGSSIGKIDIFEKQSYVAIEKPYIKKAFSQLKEGKIKGKNFSVWILE